MTITELCEPLFRYICSINRAARRRADVSMVHVRSEVDRILDEIRNRASEDPQLYSQYELVADALMFFADDMIATSRVPFADQWNANRLAFERGKMGGNEEFFEILDRMLEDRGRDARECLKVFYMCLGLGFAGIYFNDKAFIHRKMIEIADKLRLGREGDLGARVCPQAYEHVDTRLLTQPPTRSLLGIAIVLVGAIIVLFVANFLLFRDTSKELIQSLDSVSLHSLQTSPQPTGDAKAADGATSPDGESDN